MINIVNLVVRYNDNRKITGIELKLKAIPEESENDDTQHLVARVSAAFHASTLFGETGKSLKTPKVTRSLGEAPQQQLDFDELFARNPVVTNGDADIMDDDSMFGDGISDEDIDLEGLDISDGEPY